MNIEISYEYNNNNNIKIIYKFIEKIVLHKTAMTVVTIFKIKILCLNLTNYQPYVTYTF